MILLTALSGPALAAAVDVTRQSLAELKAGIEGKHPATYFLLARREFEAGRRDEAVFWFYLGQLRYRAHLAARPNLDPSGDKALFSSLMEVVGRPINEYAFGDIPTLIATIDKVVAWDVAQPDGFTSKQSHAGTRATVRQGLVELKAEVLKRQDEIRATRAGNGLGNR
ncbi:MAG TPA: hypothetical protein VIL65_05705 [Beijerinckiaceae bacterium]